MTPMPPTSSDDPAQHGARRVEALTFTLGEGRYAVPLDRVVEVLPRVWITPLAGAPPVVAGVINHRGEARVVVDLRARFSLPPRAPRLDDHLVVVRAARRTVALVVDRALAPSWLDLAPPEALSLRTAHVAGVALSDAGVVLLEDLDAALSLDEDRDVDAALAARPGGAS